MNTELHSKGVIKNRKNIHEGELPHLCLRASLRKPTSENPSIQQIPNTLHGHLSLLLHRLVIVRRNEQPPGDISGAEELALHHQPEQPVPVLEVVSVQETPHLSGIESKELRELRSRVAEAWVRRHNRAGRSWVLEVPG